MSEPYALLPGDLIFYKNDGKFLSDLVAKAELVFHETGGPPGESFIHVAMMTNDPLICVEMSWPRARFRSILLDARPKVIKRPRCVDSIKQKALVWCYSRIGEPYSVPEIVVSKLGLKMSERFCSAFAYDAFANSGFYFPLPIPDRSHDVLVSPDELSKSPLLTTVAELP